MALIRESLESIKRFIIVRRPKREYTCRTGTKYFSRRQSQIYFPKSVALGGAAHVLPVCAGPKAAWMLNLHTRATKGDLRSLPGGVDDERRRRDERRRVRVPAGPLL